MRLTRTLLATAIATASLGAQADLARQGPINPANGFPTFYQDFTGLALDLCLPNAQELIDGSCLLFPANIPNSALPISFPGNFSDELFFFNANTVVPLDTAVDPSATGNATLVLGLEAAFATGPVAVGDQIVFSRVRYKFVAPTAGSYTVTTPYTTETFDATAGELIFNTVDIGINCPPGDFSCAMKGKTAPFLRASATPGGAALAPVVLPGGNTFLADPNIPTFVTEGPVGHSFVITGPLGDLVNTSTFGLMGRIHTAPLPSFTTIDRVSYGRKVGSSQVDVFATSISGLNQLPAPQLQLLAPDLPGTILTQDDTLPTKYHGQVKPIGDALPTNVFLTNLTDVPPTVHTGNLTDLVTVSSATFASGTLNVTAASSDEVVVPTLTAIGSNGVNYGDFTAGSTLSVPATMPPDSVTVSSTNGGSTTFPVTTAAVAVASTVVAVNDSDAAVVSPITNLGAIDVLANDTGVAGTAIVRIVRKPDHGSVTVGADNKVAYSVRGSYSGPDNFTYYIDNNGAALDGDTGLSNIASVDFDVTAVNRPPVAVADTASVTQGASVTIDAILNDSDPDGDAITISNPVVQAPVVGTAVISGGKIVYTVPAGAPAGPKTITYTLSDGTLTATGTVTVTVQTAETVTVPKASYSTRTRTWQFEGTEGPVPVGTETITIRFYAGPATTQGVPGVAVESRFIGQATVTAGKFKFGPTVSPVIPVGNTFHIKTSRGDKVQNFTHVVGP
jgi:hypothetical protein